MSYHAIEDLVETYIRLVDETDATVNEKRNLFYNLYRFQQLFDTSYTELRVAEILERNEYLFRIHIQQHPDYEKHISYFKDINFTQGQWITTSVTHPDSESVYTQKIDNDPFMHVSYGSHFFRQLCQQKIIQTDCSLEKKLSVPDLFEKLLTIAKEKKTVLLMKNSYLALTNGFFEGDFSTDDGFPENVADWVNHKSLNYIRELMISEALLKIKTKEAWFTIPRLSNELYSENDPNRIFKIRFLLDIKPTLDKLLTNYEKDKKIRAESSSKIELLERTIGNHLKNQGYQLAIRKTFSEERNYFWVWIKDIFHEDYAHPNRQFIILDFDTNYNVLSFELGLQHRKILTWQQRKPNNNPKYIHTYTQISYVLSDAEFEKSKVFTPIGLFKYNLKLSEKSLAKKLQALLLVYDSVENAYFKDVENEILNQLPKRSWEKIEKDLSKDFIPDYIIFKSSFSYLLLSLFQAQENHQFEKVRAFANHIKNKLTERIKEQNIWYKNELKPFLEAIDSKKHPPLPTLPQPKYDYVYLQDL